jgi:hypothetical protein
LPRNNFTGEGSLKIMLRNEYPIKREGYVVEEEDIESESGFSSWVPRWD